MLTIKIEKDTPAAVMDATALFIKEIKEIVHGATQCCAGHDEAQTESVELAITAPTLINPHTLTPAVEAFIPPAPVVAALTAHVAVSGAEVDADGITWDKRIHASSKAKLASGAWRRKRGVSDSLVRQVEAELRNADIDDSNAGIIAAVVPPAPVAPIAPVVPVAPVAPAVPAAPAAVDAIANPFATGSTPVAPAVPPVLPATTVAGRSYSDLETLISNLILSNQTDGNKIMAICAENGLPNVAILKDAEPENIGKIYSAIETSVQ